VEAELLIADALLHLNRPTEAINGLETLAPGAIAHPAGNEPVLLAYAVTLVRCGKTARASEVLSDLARAHPEWRTNPLGVAPGTLGDAASALTWLRTCEALVPDAPEARMKLARAWGGAWEHPAFHTPELLAGARAVLTSLFSTPIAVEAHVLSATLAFENGEADAARKELAEVLQRDPSQVDAHNNLAYMLAESGRWQEAAEEAKKAILAAPKNPNYRDTLAGALRKGGDYDGAKKALEEAVLLDPANPAWRLSLAETLAEAGRADDARREIARFDELVAAGASAPGDAKARMDKVRASLR
jgi:predicted Zn-dependent protease